MSNKKSGGRNIGPRARTVMYLFVLFDEFFEAWDLIVFRVVEQLIRLHFYAFHQCFHVFVAFGPLALQG
jgi:hypothetical protein